MSMDTQDQAKLDERLAIENATECAICGDDFGKKLSNRKAKGLHNICLSCARSEGLELHEDDQADLAEHYWSSKEQG
jgi:tRNA(Ile)-lysidine synthase TilS/MesJ